MYLQIKSNEEIYIKSNKKVIMVSVDNEDEIVIKEIIHEPHF